MTKTYRVEVIEEPYSDNSLFLMVNGEPFTFKEHWRELNMMSKLHTVEAYRFSSSDYAYKKYRSLKNKNIFYVITDVNDRPFSPNHDINRASDALKKSAFINNSLKGYKISIAQLENSVRKMF